MTQRKCQDLWRLQHRNPGDHARRIVHTDSSDDQHTHGKQVHGRHRLGIELRQLTSIINTVGAPTTVNDSG